MDELITFIQDVKNFLKPSITDLTRYCFYNEGNFYYAELVWPGTDEVDIDIIKKIGTINNINEVYFKANSLEYRLTLKRKIK